MIKPFHRLIKGITQLTIKSKVETILEEIIKAASDEELQRLK